MGTMRLAFCIPVFNDWTSVSALITDLDTVVATMDLQSATVVVVDDGSTEPAPAVLGASLTNLASVDVLELRRNVGHQRAIALGLARIHADESADMVVVMDGDGEDRPADVPRLVQACMQSEGGTVVFAQRKRRSESVVFRLGYLSYKVVHLILTGRGVDIGNFCCVPVEALRRIVGVSEIWNNFSAGIVNARIRHGRIPVNRGRRIDGTSRMNLTALVTHGFSAISVYGERVATRMLGVVAALGVFTLVGISIVMAKRLVLGEAIPGWASSMGGILLVLSINLLLLSVSLLLLLLQARERANFIPLRDFSWFILRRRTWPSTTSDPTDRQSADDRAIDER
jgi:glycosyltransferase involved in cell wall biosynthesis